MIEELERKILLLEKELQEARVELSRLLSCVHEWGQVVFDPEIIQLELRNPGIEEVGTALRAPKAVVVTTPETKQRWSRTCMNCGVKEYTCETRAIKWEPLFR
jgi:hypothetical protein